MEGSKSGRLGSTEPLPCWQTSGLARCLVELQLDALIRTEFIVTQSEVKEHVVPEVTDD